MIDQASDVIVVNKLCKVYGTQDVLRGIDLTVRRGEVFGLLGPNGAGKTTTLETIVGLRRPTSGTVTVLGFDPAKDRREITERMAVQPQAAALFPTLTVWETVQLFASFYSAPREAADILREVGLEQARRVRVKHLSGGQERRLLIGIALIGNPEILVLDEPSAGLDPSARRNLWDIIDRQRQRGGTVLLSTHHMDEATQMCDRLAIIVDGRVAAEGEPEELIRQYSATATVTFTVPRPVTSADLAEFGLVGNITTTQIGAETHARVVTEDPDTILRRITFSPRLGAHDYRVQRGSLEDVFLDISNSNPSTKLSTGRP